MASSVVHPAVYSPKEVNIFPDQMNNNTVQTGKLDKAKDQPVLPLKSSTTSNKRCAAQMETVADENTNPKSSNKSNRTGTSRKRRRNYTQKPKICSIEGCTTQDKGGGFCAKHGGGRPCHHEGCSKIVAGTRFCTEHGGTRKRKCSHPNCTKGDQGGGFCAAHGGGKRCTAPGCTKREVGGNFCWRHGGGRRCLQPNCTRSPRPGGYCKFHSVSVSSKNSKSTSVTVKSE